MTPRAFASAVRRPITAPPIDRAAKVYDALVRPPEPLVVANGPVVWTPELASLAAAAEPLLAADGGANHLARIGLKPRSVIGDLDSIAGGTRAWLGEERMVHRPDQDLPDLDKALDFAFDELALNRLTVLGATGGRLDHAAVNLGILARRRLGEDLVFLGADHRVVGVAGEAALTAVPGEIWSFFTFDPAVRVSLDGVRWPLEDQPLDLGRRPSISNRATADQVTINSRGGTVIALRWFGS
jgi:thiamine pyrophosphokinase